MLYFFGPIPKQNNYLHGFFLTFLLFNFSIIFFIFNLACKMVEVSVLRDVDDAFANLNGIYYGSSPHEYDPSLINSTRWHFEHEFSHGIADVHYNYAVLFFFYMC